MARGIDGQAWDTGTATDTMGDASGATVETVTAAPRTAIGDGFSPLRVTQVVRQTVGAIPKVLEILASCSHQFRSRGGDERRTITHSAERPDAFWSCLLVGVTSHHRLSSAAALTNSPHTRRTLTNLTSSSTW